MSFQAVGLNYVLLNQVGKQNAAECQPLIQEPPSAFYEDPVLVLDFQSLYPSIMIGYNYCYSTCLGRVDPFRGTYKLGWSAQHMPEGQIALLKDHVTSECNFRLISLEDGDQTARQSRQMAGYTPSKLSVKAYWRKC
jgi:DNA polymerase elongation subunit (family B)